MIKCLIIFLLMCGVASADPINEKYSFKAFPYHGVSFKDRPASEFNNTIIRGSCFYQEWVEGDMEVVKDIFPDGMTGVVFEKCNLDNVYVASGNTVVKGCNRKLKHQNDLEVWILDDNLKPIKPMDKVYRLLSNVSIDPKNIPKKKLTKKERDDLKNSIYNPIITISP